MTNHSTNGRINRVFNRIALLEKLESRELLAADLRLLELGLKDALNSFQASLNTQALQASIPLVGKRLSSESQSQVFSQISNAINGNAATAGTTIQQVTDNLKASLGAKLSSITSPSSNADDTITFDITLSDSVVLPVSFDTGLPSLGLNLNGTVSTTVSYSFAATIGVDSGGFFLDTTKRSGFASPELDFGIDVTAAGFSASGSFGLLKVVATDAGSRLKGSFTVDLIDGDGKLRATAADLSALDLSSRFTTTSSQVSLGLNAEFGGGSINPKLSADVSLVWPFNQADPEAPMASFGELPSIAISNIRIDANSLFTSLISPMLDKVASAAQPLIEIADGFNKKVFPSDSAINLTYLDVIKTASNITSGTGFNAYADLIALLVGINSSTSEFAFFDTVSQIAGFVGNAKSTSVSGTIELGSFTIGDLRGTAPGTTLATASVTSPSQSPISVLNSKSPNFENSAKTFSKKDGGFKLDIIEDTSNAFKLFLGDDSAKLVSFAMPTYNKSFYKSFNLNTVIYVVPVNVSFSVGINAEINFAAGLDAKGLKEFVSSGNAADILDGFYIDGTKPILSITGINNAGDKTSEFLQVSGRVGYKNDFKFDLSSVLGTDLGSAFSVNGDGEFSALAIAGKLVGAATSFGNFGIDVGFNDPDGDKKYRFKEMGVDANQGLQCVFNVSGGIDWSISAFSKLQVGFRVKFDVCELTSFTWDGEEYCISWGVDFRIDTEVLDHTYDQTSGPLFKLDLSCDPNSTDAAKIANPNLATLLGDGTLRLNVGLFASERNVAPTVIDESYYMRHDGGSPSDSGGESVAVLAFGAIQSFVGVKRIQADAGVGKDIIQLAKAILAPAEINGEAGDDTLYLGSGGGTLRGGSESDRLYGGSGIDYLYGGSGEDLLYGGNSGDFLFGEGDNDELFGEDGNDQLVGDQGNDIIDGGIGRDTMFENGDFSFQLSDARLVGNGTDTLRSIEVADLTGGASANAMQVADWSGAATLRGLSGNDVYDVSFLTFGSMDVSVIDSQGTLDKLFVKGTFLADTLEVSTGLIRLKGQRVTYTGIEETTVNGLSDTDSIIVADNTGTDLTVNGESGDDTIRIGLGILSTIAQRVAVIGGTNRDTLIADDSDDTSGRFGTLGLGLLTGLGLGPSGIVFDGTSEIVNIFLGEGADSFLVTDVIFSSLDAGTGTTVFGGPGSDKVVVGDSWAATSGDLDRIQSRLTVIGGTDDGGVSSSRDLAIVSDRGKLDDFDYQITGQGISDVVKMDAVPRRTFAGVFYDPSIEYVRLDGTDRENRFSVRPSEATEFVINGNLPATRSVASRLGDFLMLDTSGTNGRHIEFAPPKSGNGTWTFTSPHKPVNFLSIERFNHVERLAVASEAAANGEPLVKVYDAETRELLYSFMAYPTSYRGGVRVATGDVDEDGIPDIITAPGKSEIHAEMYDLDGNGRVDFGDIAKFAAGFQGQTEKPGFEFVWRSDINGSGHVDMSDFSFFSSNFGKSLLAGGAFLFPDNHAPVVKVFDGLGDWSNQRVPFGPWYSEFDPPLIDEFTAYDTYLSYGVNVAVGDVTGDYSSDIVVAPYRGESQVRVFENRNFAEDFTKKFEFLAYPSDYIGGVNLAVGDFNGDNKADIVTAPATGYASLVNVFNGADLLGVKLASFYAFETTFRGGVSVAVGNIVGDASLDIVTSAAHGGSSRVRAFDGDSIPRIGTTVVAPALQIQAFTDPADNTRAPVRVSIKDHDLDGVVDEIFTSQGSDGKSHAVHVFGKQRRLTTLEPIAANVADELFENDPELHNGFYLG